ncbi:hypothetical protein [Streptomyces sp. NPDC088400]|uniref:hypothetical protein n=1 Tax=Streptomyces sp. NPDC088400 TaxID=3365861 RepID=UPI0037FD6C8F
MRLHLPERNDLFVLGGGAVPDNPRTPVPAPPGRFAGPLQRLLFGGVYGTVLASVLAAALGHDGGPNDPGYDAVWVLLAAVASAAAHGYAHAIVHQTADSAPVTAATVRSVLTEWPLVTAVLPTVALLLGAYAGWWDEDTAIDVALTLNTVALFGWGLWASRVAGRGWAASCRAGGVDMLLGLCIVGANALSK